MEDVTLGKREVTESQEQDESSESHEEEHLNGVSPEKMKKSGKRGRKKLEVDYLKFDNPVTELVSKFKAKTKKYSSFLYEGETYSVGDDVLVINTHDNMDPYVCRIKEMLLIETSPGKQLPVLYVMWYYTKYNISKKLDRYFKYMSERELFMTDHLEHICLKVVIPKKCQVVDFEEYERIDSIPPDMYFTRASYSVNACELTPSPSVWPKHCVCNSPLNPDQNYIQCEDCHKWFHYNCVYISPELADNIQQYFCNKCSEKANNGHSK